jgi:hypothetical protein
VQVPCCDSRYSLAGGSRGKKGAGAIQATNASRVHGTIERTTRMLSVRSAAKCALSFACRSPPLPFGLPRVNAANAFYSLRTLPEPVSRCGLSLVRNDACTPLRSQCSRPAPSIPRRIPSRIRSIADSFAPFGFEADSGAISLPATRFPRRSPALSWFLPVSTPLQVLLQTLQIDAFNRPHHVKLILPGSDLRLLPVAVSFDPAPAQHSRPVAPRSTNRSVNPGTESIMHPNHPARQTKNVVFMGLSTAFCDVNFQ